MAAIAAAMGGMSHGTAIPTPGNRSRALINDISDRGKSDHHSDRMGRVGSKDKAKEAAESQRLPRLPQAPFHSDFQAWRTETHSEKGDGLPVVNIAFEPDPANGILIMLPTMHRNRSVKRYSGGMPILANAHENRPNWISPKATSSRNMNIKTKKIRKGGKNI